MGNLSFWTTGEDFTNLVRSLWEEGTAWNALGCLEGLSFDVRFDILEGRKKLVGDTRAGDLKVVEDTYPGKLRGDLLKELEEKHIQDLHSGKLDPQTPRSLYYLSELLGDTGPELKIRLQQKLDTYRHKLAYELKLNTVLSGLEWADEVLFKQIDPQKVQIIQITKQNIRSLSEEHLEFQQNNYEEKYENPSETFFNSAWISKAGRFWPCPDLWHAQCALDITTKEGLDRTNPERELEKLGWCKLSAGRVYTDTFVNDLQWNAIKKWMENPINKESWSGKKILFKDKWIYLNQI